MILYTKLRSNIRLNDDIDLAKRELTTMFEEVRAIASPLYYQKANISPNNIRLSSPLGFTCRGPKVPLESILHSLNFVQEVWVKKDDPILGKGQNGHRGYTTGNYVLFVPFMAFAELLEKTQNGHPLEAKQDSLTAFLAGDAIKDSASYHNAVNVQASSTQHVHGLHKYKAKFFPRFVRSQIVTHIIDVPPNQFGNKTILDPFVGSGTALVEASLLGYQSFGLDIDKLSCAISKAKIDILNLEYDDTLSHWRETEQLLQSFKSTSSREASESYKFPSIMAQKFRRWNAQKEQHRYEQEISFLIDFVSKICDPDLQSLVRISLSDALCKKFNVRMMGTGSGRFALEIAKTELFSLFVENLKNLLKILSSVASLKKRFAVSPAPSEVHTGNAKAMPFSDAHMSLVVTSPPYLPASSGRENYLVGKAISMTALNLVTEKELEVIDANSVGSIRAFDADDDGSLPQGVYDLVRWLENDPLRSIKARPVLNYYIDLKQSLHETMRVLVPGGVAVYIIGKTSTFYNAKTRDIVYQVNCDDIFRDLAVSIGFRISEKTDVELDKKNKNARPRSLDAFFESAFALKKPE